MKKNSHKLNDEIRYYQVRVTGDNIESKIVTTKEALELADFYELDLFEINANANPPVCKIGDYKKFLYETEKRSKDQNKNKVVNKEIQLTSNISENDLNTKINHIIKFLKAKARVKVVLTFKGREIVYKDKGELILLQLIEKVAEFGSAEALPKLDGKKYLLNLKPK
jgi:translation initiation factor IF-3